MLGDDTPISSLTGMRPREWLKEMERSAYPRDLQVKILNGILDGVRVDFVGNRQTPRFGRNLPVEEKDMAKIDVIIAADVAAGKKSGPHDTPPFDNLIVSPIGAVPKKSYGVLTGKVRMIHHLSYPFRGDSINASVLEEPLALGSFSAAARAVVRLGRGCFLIKLDVEAAYKQVPVHRDDWPLLGFMWRGKYYYERVLPFGLKSSCRLWDWYAAALHHFFVATLRIGVVVHYIDDFLFVVEVREQAREQLSQALALCERLGMPMAPDKTEGPTTCLTFLGIELDTSAMEARLPAPKLAELRLLTEVWRTKPSATVRELQSLAGMLMFACAVVVPGRIFTRRIFGQMALQARESSNPHQPWPVTEGVRDDVSWWALLLESWNGVSLLYELDWIEAERIELFTDACLSGFGALFGRRWFAAEWTDEILAAAQRETRESMPFLEMYALVAAAATWGHLWTGKKITFRCDCMPAVQAILRAGSSDPGMLSLLRHLTLIACRQGFDYRVDHIAGVTNVVADVLSRAGDCQEFRSLCPDANRRACPIVPIPVSEENRA